MSHTTTLKGVRIQSKRAIQRATETLRKSGVKVELVEKAKPRMFYAAQANEVGICDYVLKLADSKYDVGLKWNDKDKSYDVILDTWNGEIHRSIGATCNLPNHAGKAGEAAIGRFAQRVGIEQAIEAAEEQGYIVEDEIYSEETGDVQLVFANSY